MKKLLCMILALAMVFSLAACGGTTASETKTDTPADAPTTTTADPVVIKFGYLGSEGDTKHITALKFKELVEERTEGRYILDLYPNGVLGNERDLIEGVKMGSIGMCFTASTVLANFVPVLMVCDMPYLFKDTAHADRVYMGEIGQELIDAVDEAGFKCMAIMETDFRNMSNNTRPVESVEDVAGLRIRVMENALHQELWAALGADAPAMSWTDAYTSVQQGAIDGLELTSIQTRDNDMPAICRYYAITQHIYTPMVMLMNQGIWDKIPEADQEIINQAIEETGIYSREVTRQQEAEALEELSSQFEVVTYPDLSAFREKMAVVYEAHADEYGDLLTRIQNA